MTDVDMDGPEGQRLVRIVDDQPSQGDVTALQHNSVYDAMMTRPASRRIWIRLKCQNGRDLHRQKRRR